jgi:hypothetical protein
MRKPNFNGPRMDPPEPDPDKVTLRETTHTRGCYEIIIGEMLAGYATLGDGHVTIESADPANEWTMKVSHKDLGEGLAAYSTPVGTTGPTTPDILVAVGAWVYDHIDDFEGVEE